MSIFKIIVIFFVIFSLNFDCIAQKDTLKRIYNYLDNQKYEEVIPLYEGLLTHKQNPEYYFNLSYVYLQTHNQRSKAISTLNNGISIYNTLKKSKQRKSKISLVELKYLLAIAYEKNYKYDSALFLLNEVLPQIKKKDIRKKITDDINQCLEGQKLTSNPVNVKISNLGSSINSKYTEHTPLITVDESEIYFTSRRPNNTKAKMYDNEYDENIFYAFSDESDTGWTKSKPLAVVNGEDNEATVALSYDGAHLVIYKGDKQGDLYMSDYQDNGKWSAPIKLPKPINSGKRETSASLTYDDSTVYFTSNRGGSKRGMDIWTSTLQKNGKWSKAKNLGSPVNTKFDEEAPFISPDGNTLFFSSNGHGGLGGYDIFSSIKDASGNWSEPVNMGFAINTVDDDIFFYPTLDNSKAYVASKKAEGLGRSDLYFIQFNDPAPSKYIIVTSSFFVCDGDLPIAKISITDLSKGKTYKVTDRGGNIFFIAEKGSDYKLVVKVGNDVVFDDVVKLPLNCPTKVFYKNINLNPETQCDKSVIATVPYNLVPLDKLVKDQNGNYYTTYTKIGDNYYPVLDNMQTVPNQQIVAMNDSIKNNQNKDTNNNNNYVVDNNQNNNDYSNQHNYYEDDYKNNKNNNNNNNNNTNNANNYLIYDNQKIDLTDGGKLIYKGNPKTDVVAYHIQVYSGRYPASFASIRQKLHTDEPITVAFVDGLYKYWLGEYDQYVLAKKKLDQIKQFAPGAFVVGTINNNQADVKLAIQAERAQKR